jgi:hypothetical protein
MRFRGFLTGWFLGGVLTAFSATAQTVPAEALAKLPAPAQRAYYQTAFEQQTVELYAKLGLGSAGLPLAVFREGMVGYYNLRPVGQKTSAPSVLTLIDFDRPSQQKRLWVIDVAKAKVLFHTLVAHGKASGADVPLAFSDKNGSEMSSLGFYRTAPTTYTGKHGLSLKIHGLDEDFVKAHGRLGRSQGCPALPVAETAAIVKAIKGGSVIYLHGPARAGYRSQWLNVDTAVAAFAGQHKAS